MEEKAVFKAAKDGDIAKIHTLLAAEPELVWALDKQKSTPLHWAAYKGHPGAIEVLLDAGAEIDAQSENFTWGTTPLHAAANGNHREAAAALIRRGADINALKADGSGSTPLNEARTQNSSSVARLLRESGATD